MKKQTNFYVWLRSGLRKLSRRWPPVFQALANAKEKYEGDNKRRKFSYRCAECGNLEDAKSVSVDHIIPAGQLNSKEDIAEFVEKLFCTVDGLQVLCDDCHATKTYMERYSVSKEDAIVALKVAQVMKDKKLVLQILKEYDIIAKNDVQRKEALKTIFTKEANK